MADHEEARIGTDPLLPDTDGDGLYDAFEVRKWCFFLDDYGRVSRVHTSPLSSDADGDGLSDSDECLFYLTDPFSPSVSRSVSDSDGDGLSDFAEDLYGGDRLYADYDADGFSDRVEVGAGTDPWDSNSHP